ncbi:MAG TPA: VWA domain-containing protein [Jiangellaceae bacterium]|nr:VWA domain-containing protein [Jiangellaceae bacterium]
MARHRAPRRRPGWMLVAALGSAALAVSATSVAVLRDGGSGADPGPDGAGTMVVNWCTTLRVVTATSFEPVLTDLAAHLNAGKDCVRLEVTTADGRGAEEVVAEVDAHVWIPDDTAWAGITRTLDLDPELPGSGTVVATSPVFMVTDGATADRLNQAGGGWLELADLLTTASDARLVVRDPADWADGLVAVGAVGEAVWLEEGMDASAEALMTAFPATRTVSDHAVPVDVGDIGLIPEYALLTALAHDEEAAAAIGEATLLAGDDHTAMLRYSWLPMASTGADPDVTVAMDRLFAVLTGDESADARAAAGLRGPDAEPLDASPIELPLLDAAPFGVLGTHQVEHVFATWYAEDRRSDMLLVIDISGSMAAPAEGSDTPRIDLVREGVLSLADLLPDDSALALWQFGAQLEPPRDYVELLPRAELDETHRQALGDAAESLVAISTGTGLYDTTLAAYRNGLDGYRDGVPNYVIVFTDGRNEDRPGSITVQQLADELSAARDPERPVQLTIIALGDDTDVEALEIALEPVESYISQITTAQDVRAAFIHLAAGARH